MKKLLATTLSTAVLLGAGITHGEQAEAATTKKLDEKSKITLAYFTKDIGEYSFTRKEIISGHYLSKLNGGSVVRDFKTFDIVRLKVKIKGAPKNMEFYTTKNPRGSFATIIGVSDTTILTSGTQYDASYSDLVDFGKKYNMKNYLKYKSTKDFNKIVKKIRFVKSDY